MPADVTIRRATAADATAIARLLHDFNVEFEDPTPPAPELAGYCERLLRDGAMTVLLAGAEPGASDGLALLRLRPPWTGAEEAYLQELYVVPARRRQGIGEALLEATIAAARGAAATSLDLNTGATDTGARALYEKLGFTNEEGPGGPSMLFYEREI
jgi:ribosomal protein S18 acetylase RimI-like enzyme